MNGTVVLPSTTALPATVGPWRRQEAQKSQGLVFWGMGWMSMRGSTGLGKRALPGNECLSTFFRVGGIARDQAVADSCVFGSVTHLDLSSHREYPLEAPTLQGQYHRLP